jgi:urease accessory protein
MSDASLRLLQLVSPALPVGAFSYAEGLEALQQQGLLGDAQAVRAWLAAELAGGGLTIEAASLTGLRSLLARWAALTGAPDPGAPGPGEPAPLEQLLEWDSWLLAQRDAAGMRAQQRQMGQSLLQLLADLGWPLPSPVRLAWPAAWAWAGLVLELGELAVVEGYLYGWVANQLSAAVRLVPLGPTEAQRLQLGLAPLIAERAGSLLAADPRQLWNAGVGAGLAQLRQDELYSRLFRS